MSLIKGAFIGVSREEEGGLETEAMGVFIMISSECEIFIDWQLAVKDLSSREYPFCEVL